MFLNGRLIPTSRGCTNEWHRPSMKLTVISFARKVSCTCCVVWAPKSSKAWRVGWQLRTGTSGSSSHSRKFFSLAYAFGLNLITTGKSYSFFSLAIIEVTPWPRKNIRDLTRRIPSANTVSWIVPWYLFQPDWLPWTQMVCSPILW